VRGDFPEAHNDLGNALKEQGKLDEAVVSYRRVLELRGDCAEAYYGWANALTELAPNGIIGSWPSH
jgi:cytochrome c-type biogenesis protein CcmH/NrfG